MADSKKFIIGSRGSKLSLAYSGNVKDLLLKKPQHLLGLFLCLFFDLPNLLTWIYSTKDK